VIRWLCRGWLVCEAIGLGFFGPVPIAHAQSSAEPRLGVAIGPQWLGRGDVGGEDARLTRNPIGSTPLFDTRSALAGGMGVSGSVAGRVTRQLWVEAIGRYHSARLTTRVTGDAEARDVTASEAVQHLVIEGGALWMPRTWRVGHRVQLFATGGLGYLRQLHETGTLVETGRSYHAGGGAVIALPTRQNGTFKASGVRLEVRAAALDGGVAFGDGIHVAPAIWTALFLRF
jgi:hypothetical protein